MQNFVIYQKVQLQLKFPSKILLKTKNKILQYTRTYRQYAKSCNLFYYLLKNFKIELKAIPTISFFSKNICRLRTFKYSCQLLQKVISQLLVVKCKTKIARQHSIPRLDLNLVIISKGSVNSADQVFLRVIIPLC